MKKKQGFKILIINLLILIWMPTQETKKISFQTREELIVVLINMMLWGYKQKKMHVINDFKLFLICKV